MKIYVLNLDRDRGRLQWMDSQLNRLGLPYERVSALTPETVPDALRRRFLDRASEALLPSEIACFASHLAIAEEFLTTSEDVCVVLEDDVEIICDAIELEALSLSAREFDFLKLSDWPKSPTVLVTAVGGFLVLRFLRVPLGQGSYFISRAGAKRLLESAWGLATPIDQFVRSEAFLSFDVAGVVPPPIPQDRFGASSLDPAKRRNKQKAKLYSYEDDSIIRKIKKIFRASRTFGPMNMCRLLFLRVVMKLNRTKRDENMQYIIVKKQSKVHDQNHGGQNE